MDRTRPALLEAGLVRFGMQLRSRCLLFGAIALRCLSGNGSTRLTLIALLTW